MLLAVVAIAASPVDAADWKPLTGTYAVTGESYLDPAEGDAKDSHYRLQLSGASAEDLFKAMKVSTTTDECTHAVEKRLGEMRCLYFAAEKRYECAFSINLHEQRVEYGVSC